MNVGLLPQSGCGKYRYAWICEWVGGYISGMSFSSDRPQIAWSLAPLLVPVGLFAAGIGLSVVADYRYGTLAGSGAVALTVIAYLLHLRPRPSGLTGRIASALLLLAMALAGSWYATVRHPPGQVDHLGRRYVAGDRVVATVDGVRRGNSGWTVDLTTTGLLRQDSLHPVSGKLVAYLRGDRPAVGDELLIEAAIDTVAAPLNPEVFDYAAYLKSQNIYHRAFVDSSEWLTVRRSEGLSMRAFCERSRDFWFNSLRPYLAGDRLAVAAALIMGKRDLLDRELRSSYADTGAIHVLAVSGLHVGILALIVTQLLGWLLPSNRYADWLKTLVTIALVGYFALITGLSASVQRAALMVSIVLIGKRIDRGNSIFNLLAVAALVMLIAEPKQLLQVGFQLSFSAVAGIALFARPLQRLLFLPRPLSWGWDAIAVSTAAQLGTLPLSLYYFGQFPLYFMLSGTLVIVFAYGVLALGLLHGFLATVGLSGAGLQPTGLALNLVVGLQNRFIELSSQLPGATLQWPDFGLPSVVGLYLAIALLAYLAFRPSHRGRWALLATAGLLLTYWVVHPITRVPPDQFTIYHLSRASLIDVYAGGRSVAIGDSLSADQLAYNVLPLRRKLGTTSVPLLSLTIDTTTAPASIRYPYLRLLDRIALIVDGKVSLTALQVQGADLILIRSGIKPSRVPQIPSFIPIVVDGSNPPWVATQWLESYPHTHLTSTRGAYRYPAQAR